MQKVNQKWCDAECNSARAALRQLSGDPHEHAANLKSYKQMLRRKRCAWERTTQQNLCEMASRNPQSFWRQYKERQSSKCNIPKEQRRASFEALYKAPKAPTAASTDDISAIPVNPPQSPTPDLIAESGPDAPEPAIDFLNAVITHEDVTAALKRLKRRKAAGVDGIRAGFILDASDISLKPLVQTFNKVLDKGVPFAWCTFDSTYFLYFQG